MKPSRSAAGHARRPKYRNIKTEVDGRAFDSKKEARRYLALKEDQQAGRICGLRLQVGFRLKVAGITICFYRADFVYVRQGRRVVEDVKGLKTRVYEMKKKLMKACHGIEIEES